MPSLRPLCQCGATDLWGWWRDFRESNWYALATRTCKTHGAPSVSDRLPAQAADPGWARNWSSAGGGFLSTTQWLAGLLSPGAQVVFLESWWLNSFFVVNAPGIINSLENLYRERFINTSLFYHHWRRVWRGHSRKQCRKEVKLLIIEVLHERETWRPTVAIQDLIFHMGDKK